MMVLVIAGVRNFVKMGFENWERLGIHLHVTVELLQQWLVGRHLQNYSSLETVGPHNIPAVHFVLMSGDINAYKRLH